MPLPRAGRWPLRAVVIAAVVITAACSSDDEDFAAAPDDRGAAAAETVGAESLKPEPHAQPTTPMPPPPPPPPAPPPSADPERGRQVFFANGCNACHGDQGQGGIGPTIAQTRFSVDRVIGQYRSPRGLMPPFPASVIPDETVADVRAWLQTLPLPEDIVPGEGTP